MGRRFLTALILAALAAGAWWITHDGGEPGEGLVVHLQVRDAAGAAVATAQVERVFEGTRLRVDAEGRARLASVVLRELDEPSPETIARAIRVEAPFHALRRGATPTVTRRDDGSWSMDVTLEAHGVLRLYVAETHLGPCKAFPEGLHGDHLEAIGSRDVARHGSPASYRVFGGADEVVVRLEGEPDDSFLIAVATRKLFFAPPNAGHVLEQVLKPEQVEVIVGQVRTDQKPPPPSLGGVVRVTELAEDGRRIPLALVKVRADGQFFARRTGKGRYELEADLDFFPGTTKVTVLGGASFDLKPSKPALWTTLKHEGLDLSKRTVRVRLRGGDEEIDPRWLPGEERSYVALPSLGNWVLRVEVDGTDDAPPLRGPSLHSPTMSGEGTSWAGLQPAPHGTLRIRVPEAAFGKARGATVRVGSRTKTLIPGLAEKVTFKHVPVGAHEVRIEWDEEGRADTTKSVELAEGATLDVEVSTP